ncbi:MAG: hypothetical protein PHX80_03740 [Candidatus Nanoarchaeia archaeon]|nr:hypothetical protein [Candidatus Nanoarchaeia archaeon]
MSNIYCHKINQQLHADKRAKERLDIDFNHSMAKSIIHQIKNGTISAGFKTGKNRIWYFTIIEDKKCWLLYDKKTNRIVTFLDDVPRGIYGYKAG